MGINTIKSIKPIKPAVVAAPVAGVGKMSGASLGGKATAKPVSGGKVGSAPGAVVLSGKAGIANTKKRGTSTGYMTR